MIAREKEEEEEKKANMHTDLQREKIDTSD
jgi:hypothetical protein